MRDEEEEDEEEEEEEESGGFWLPFAGRYTPVKVDFKTCDSRIPNDRPGSTVSYLFDPNNQNIVHVLPSLDGMAHRAVAVPMEVLGEQLVTCTCDCSPVLELIHRDDLSDHFLDWIAESGLTPADGARVLMIVHRPPILRLEVPETLGELV